MKKFLVLVLMFVVLAFTVPSAAAQTRHRRQRHGRTFWQKHRDKLTVAGTSGRRGHWRPRWRKERRADRRRRRRRNRSALHLQDSQASSPPPLLICVNILEKILLETANVCAVRH